MDADVQVFPVWMVLREVLVLLAMGLTLGLAIAWATARFVESFLFGMRARDPLALILAASILAVSAVAAGYAPARRDPVDALRYD